MLLSVLTVLDQYVDIYIYIYIYMMEWNENLCKKEKRRESCAYIKEIINKSSEQIYSWMIERFKVLLSTLSSFFFTIREGKDLTAKEKNILRKKKKHERNGTKKNPVSLNRKEMNRGNQILLDCTSSQFLSFFIAISLFVHLLIGKIWLL